MNVTLFGWTNSLERYWSNMIGTKMQFSTASMGDLPGGDEGLMTTNWIRPHFCLGDDIIDDDNEGDLESHDWSKADFMMMRYLDNC